MFPTFTGSARRPRQVNLSGRTSNPFAKSPVSNPIASAQQDRLVRQQERQKQKAAVSIQRVWRGHRTRRAVQEQRRRHYDDLQSQDDTSSGSPRSYTSDQDAIERTRLLLRFLHLQHRDDVQRLQRHCQRLSASSLDTRNPAWTALLLQIEARCLDGLARAPTDMHKSIWAILHFTSPQIPQRDLEASISYYGALARLALKGSIALDMVLTPLKEISPATIFAYQGLIVLLMVPHLSQRLADSSVDQLAQHVNSKLLSRAVAMSIKEKVAPFDVGSHTSVSVDARQWLLGHLIRLHGSAYRFSNPPRFSADTDFIYAVSTLLAGLADEIDMDVPTHDFADDDDNASSRTVTSKQRVEPFVRDQILTMLNQESVGGLISKIGPVTSMNNSSSSARDDLTQTLASYILTLLRLFPKRADDIRMWLYLGDPNTQSQGAQGAPIIKLFWSAIKSTSVFKMIFKDAKAAVPLLKPHAVASGESDQEWRVIFIFIELYSFVLKVMDDEEFFAGSRIAATNGESSQRNTLPLPEIELMSIFLKHLGFTMYYKAAEISADSEEERVTDIKDLFRPSRQPATSSAGNTRKPSFIAGIYGVSLDYLKGLVTGLTRAIYERDSRRPFLPRDHWLMTSRFDMSNFIDAVVEEEGRRNELQEAEDEEGAAQDHDEPMDEASPSLIGTGHAQRLARIERMQRDQRRASRRRYLQAVAPRLEILQNLPFLIPFMTRVQIFRRFIRLDQAKLRSSGYHQRMAMMMAENPHINPLERHQAKIRRDHEFEDAYDQFFDLGSALKEPISITFVDQFDQPEAGIDGGGVTKEFLTSVTNKAFKVDEGVQLFVENDQHLLHPNPSAFDELKYRLREAGVKEGSAEYKQTLLDLTQRYEFLGRIIGKCLYEGILVDIDFAGFFLLKWALIGGQGNAPRESGYRASLNDLRDLDEELYQGLIKLKNYSGDVEDFALDFTVTDVINVPNERGREPITKTITRNLKPGGSSIPVTNANRLAYISYMAHHRLAWQSAQQTHAFHKGLSTLIEPSWLSMFNQIELQTLIGGTPAEIDVMDLRRNTVYGGVYQIGDDGLEHPSVQMFWDVMHEIPDEDRRKVLKFVTSTPRAPLLGFASLNPKFSIKDSGSDDKRLPSTSTCMNLLKLPRFSSKQVCKDKLLQAVNSGAGFDLS